MDHHTASKPSSEQLDYAPDPHGSSEEYMERSSITASDRGRSVRSDMATPISEAVADILADHPSSLTMPLLSESRQDQSTASDEMAPLIPQSVDPSRQGKVEADIDRNGESPSLGRPSLLQSHSESLPFVDSGQMGPGVSAAAKRGLFVNTGVMQGQAPPTWARNKFRRSVSESREGWNGEEGSDGNKYVPLPLPPLLTPRMVSEASHQSSAASASPTRYMFPYPTPTAVSTFSNLGAAPASPHLILPSSPRKLSFAECFGGTEDQPSKEDEWCTTVFALGEGVSVESGPITLRQFRNLLNMDRPKPVWIDVSGVHSEVVEIIGEHFNLHSMTVEDCTHYVDDNGKVNTMLEREKMEIFKSHNYCYIQYHALDEGEEFALDRVFPVKLLVFDNLLITMHHKPVPIFKQIIDKMKGKPVNISWLVYDILKSITMQHFCLVEETLAEVDTLDHLVDVLSRDEMNDFLRRARIVRRNLVQLQITISAKRRVVNSMSHEPGVSRFFPNVHYLHDLFDHQSTMLTRLEFSDQLLHGVQESFEAKSNLEVSEISMDISLASKRLSLVATLFMPLTLLTGVMGMNVKLPGNIDTESEHGYIPFVTVILLCLSVIVLGLGYFKRAGMW